jgi:3-deoxy-D-manno-octulosonate 8-phosphate phosphatase (KDO 8-P phosphatase)
MSNLIERAKKIKCVICDIDGVLTDGLVYIDNFANELKAFNIQDGLGLKLLMAADIEVAVITGSKNAVIDHRMKQLDIRHYFTGQLNKQIAFQKLKNTLSLENNQFAYIGDDLPDLIIMEQVGLSIAVENAVSPVKDLAHWCTNKHGGRGAVREACDFILGAQNKLGDAFNRLMSQ